MKIIAAKHFTNLEKWIKDAVCVHKTNIGILLHPVISGEKGRMGREIKDKK